MSLDHPLGKFDKTFDLNSALEEISGESFRFIYSYRFGLMVYPVAPVEVKIGGVGITNRNLQQILNHIGIYYPDRLRGSLERADSVIIFGNGLSLASLELKKKFPQKRVAIVDMVDYAEMERIYSHNQKIIFQILLNYPQYRMIIEENFDQAIALMRGARRGSIEIFNHVFGAGIDPEFGKFDLGLNCYGPPSETIREQLRMITPKGEIFYRGLGEGIGVFTQEEI